MSLTSSYKTIANDSQYLLIEKKSKFMANIITVKNEEEAKAFIQSMKKKFYDASHNVYAYRVGEVEVVERYCDDGEPSQTAGMPILNILMKEGLTNIVIVVTRYYGGINLGTGGLVRAYSESAKKALELANIITKKLFYIVKISVEYDLSSKVQYEITHNNYILNETIYLEDVTFIVLVDYNLLESFCTKIINVTNNKALIETKNTIWN